MNLPTSGPTATNGAPPEGAAPPAPAPSRSWRDLARRYEWALSAGALFLIVLLVWMWLYHLRGPASWRLPVGYGGDGWLIFGTAKAYMEGAIWPVLPKIVPTLNAPFTANWNDYPITEDLIYAAIGWLGRAVGLFTAGNLVLLGAHLLAAWSFWWVCRQLRYRPALAFAGALVYAFSPYLVYRGLGHVALTYCWHIPLLLLVLQRAYAKEDIPRFSRNFWVAVGASAACGVLNPYYTGMYLQLLGFGVLLHATRRQWSKAAFCTGLIGLTFATFLAMNADTLVYNVVHGPNGLAAGRNLAALEVYGLKIPELFLPADSSHPFQALANFAEQHYYSQAYIKGEQWGPYLGLVGIAAFLLLVGTSGYRLLQGQLQRIPSQFWIVLWILLYSLIGGINLLIGAFGFVYFRATNRYSIFLLTIALLFAVRFLSRKVPRRLLVPVAFALAVAGLGEMVARGFVMPLPSDGKVRAMIDADRGFAQAVERAAPAAMVFQLPVAGFPEVGPIGDMADYEHFRPYLFTKTLHYSYGTNKGRGYEEWQLATAKLAPAEMARKLESYGFGVIMVNRKGYPDHGKALLDALVAAGKPVMVGNQDLVAVRLQPSANRGNIDPWPLFASGWSPDEGTHRWAIAREAEIRVINMGAQAVPHVVSFRLGAMSAQPVQVYFGDTLLATLNVPAGGGEVALPPTRILVPPGSGSLRLKSSAPLIRAGNGDSRQLSFRISAFQLGRAE